MQSIGIVLINTPFHLRVSIFFICTLVFLIFLLLISGEFAEKHIVKGFLNSASGTASIYAPRPGIISQCFHQRGGHVKKGEPLFVIQTRYQEKTDEVLQQLLINKQNFEKEITYKKKHLSSLKNLLKKHFVSKESYDLKKEEILNLIRSLSMVQLQILNHKKELSYIISAPISGTLSALSNYQTGQFVNNNKPLAKIIPKDSQLIAELYVPAQQAGFLKKNASVRIRLDAFSYQHFGSVKAQIRDISPTIFLSTDEDKPITVDGPYYKVIATLDRPYLNLYGKPTLLQHGMTITAVIVGSKRKLWQWILDPLYGFYGELFYG
ncbi:HlyD family secretion protein [Legionella adelaidensis]|nr:HlyD family efflux transporter periplasmic adaptor subunit [Legionella adelaidensis]